MKHLWALALLTPLLAAGGCGPAGRIRPPQAVGQIDVISLRLVPAPVNLDEKPGADGFIAQVSFYRFARPEPVAIKGTLEVMLFAGGGAPETWSRQDPFQVWSFTPEELARCMIRDRGLWSYAVPLPWRGDGPRCPCATLIARYRPAEGRPVLSAPSTVPLANL